MKTSHQLQVLIALATALYTQPSVAQQTPPATPSPVNGNNPLANPAEKVKVKHSIISFGFFSPLNEHISLGFDQLINDDFVLTTQLGIIGPGLNRTYSYSERPIGGFIEAGAKLFFSPTWVIDGMRRYNKMQGGYFKPQIILSIFSQPYANYNWGTGQNTYTSQTYSGIALMLNLGHQWVFSNSFVLDIYAGVGYALSLNQGTTSPYGTYTPVEPNGGNYFSFISAGSDFPIAFSAGVNLGIPF